MQQADETEDERLEDLRRRRRTALFAASLLIFLALAFSAEPADAVPPDAPRAAVTPAPPPSPQLRDLSSAILAASRGLVYPLTLGERFQGSWALAGSAALAPAFLRPELAPNFTVVFGLHTPAHPPAALGFAHAGGDVSMQFKARRPFDDLPALQEVTAAVELFDGAAAVASAGGSGGAPRGLLAVVAQGIYAADAGLVLMVGSSLGGGINVRLVASPSASASTAASASASASASVSAAPVPVASPSSSAIASSSVSTSPVPSNASTSPFEDVGRPRRLAAAQGGAAADRCDILFALRMRPWAFDPAFPSSAARALRDSASFRDIGDPEPAPVLAHRLARALGFQSVASLLPPALRPWYELALQRSREAERATSPDGGEGDGYTGAPVLSPQVLAELAAELFLPDATAAADASEASRRRLQLLMRTAALSAEAATTAAVSEAPALGRRLVAAGAEDSFAAARFVPMFGHAVSLNCNISLNVSVVREAWNEAVLEEKAMNFALLAIFGGISLLGVTTFQIVSSASQTAAFRVSLLTMGIQAVIDCWLSFIYTVAGMVSPNLFSSFAALAFVHLVLFTVLEMRFMLMILKARRPDAFSEGWPGVRREVTRLYVRFYLCIIVSFTALWLGSVNTLRFVLALAYSLWVPQIAHSAQLDARHGLRTPYVLMTSAVRLLPLLYLACPYNVLFALLPAESRAAALAFGASDTAEPFDFVSPQPGWRSYMLGTSAVAPAFASPAVAALYWGWARFAGLMVVWVALQVTVLALQEKTSWGPRFFVPYVFLPTKYDYHRAIEVRDGRVLPNPRATAQWMAHLRPPHDDEGDSGAAAAGPADAAAANPAAVGAGAPGAGALGAAGASAVAPLSAAANDEGLVGQAGAAGTRLAALARGSSRSALRTSRALYAGGVVFLSGMAQLAEDGVAYAHRLRFRARRSGGGAAPAPTPALPSSAASVAGTASSWLHFFSPRSRGRRYAHLEDDVEMAELPHSHSHAHAGDDSAAVASASADEAVASVAAAETGDGSGSGGSGDSGAKPADHQVHGNGGSGVSGSAASDAARLAALAAMPTAGAATAPLTPTAPVAVDPESQPLPPDDPLIGSADFGGVDCVVCMEAITFPARASSYMVTPCDHLFHERCLRPWLELALQCPTCRLQLPPP